MDERLDDIDREILVYLRDRAPIQQMAKHLGRSKSTIFYHLHKLIGLGYVTTVLPAGYQGRYALSEEGRKASDNLDTNPPTLFARKLGFEKRTEDGEYVVESTVTYKGDVVGRILRRITGNER